MNEFEKNMEDIFDIEVESTDIEPVEDAGSSVSAPVFNSPQEETANRGDRRPQLTILLKFRVALK